MNELLQEASQEGIKAAKYLPTEMLVDFKSYQIYITPRLSEHESTQFCCFKTFYLRPERNEPHLFKINHPPA